MKKLSCLGNKASGFVLSSLIALCVLLIGCTKDDESVTPSVEIPTISINPTNDIELAVGDTLMVYWKIDGNSKNNVVTLDGEVVSEQKVGEFAKKMTQIGIHIFKVSCFASDGKTPAVPDLLKVTVKPITSVLPNVSLTVSASTITRGDSVRLDFVAKYAKWVTLTSQPATRIEITDTVGHIYVKPTIPTIFTLTAGNDVGESSDSKTVNVNNPPPPTPLEHLQLDKWYLKVWKIDGQVIPIPACQSDDYYIFFENLWFEEHRNIVKCDPGENELFGNGFYSLGIVNDTLRLETGVGNGMIHNVSLLNATDLKLYFKVYCPDPDCVLPVEFYEMEYTHEQP